jgi:hypothetical protein
VHYASKGSFDYAAGGQANPGKPISESHCPEDERYDSECR